MDNKWRVLISTGPLDKDYLEAEVWYEGELWAVLSEFGKTVEFYARKGNNPWRLDFGEVMTILNRLANEKLDGSGSNEQSEK